MLRSGSLTLSLAALCCALLASPGHASGATGKQDCVCSPEQTSKAFTAVAKKTIPAVVFIKIQSNSPDLDENGNTYQTPTTSTAMNSSTVFLAIPTVETSLKSPSRNKARVPDSL